MNVKLSFYFILLSYAALAGVDKDVSKSVFANKINLIGFQENLSQINYPDGKPAPEVRYVFKQGNLKIFLLKTGMAYQMENYLTPTLSQGEGEAGAQPSQSTGMDSESFFIDTMPKRIQTYRMDMQLVGANPNPEIIAEGKSEDYINYYNHNALRVHTYKKITYKNIYPGIDWVIYQSLVPSHELQETPKNSQLVTRNSQSIKYDFIIHPGSDPSQIKLKYSNTEQIYLEKDGNLILRNRLGDIKENAPIAFQENDNIISKFLLKDSILTFEIKKYDRNQILIIDPKLEWSTYYGGSENDISKGSILDKSNNIYIYGESSSSSNIAYNGFQTNFISTGFGSQNGMIVKFNQYGQRLGLAITELIIAYQMLP